MDKIEKIKDAVDKIEAVYDKKLDKMNGSQGYMHAFDEMKIKTKAIISKLAMELESIDIALAPIQIKISYDGKVVWINTHEKCIFRASKIPKLDLQDDRKK